MCIETIEPVMKENLAKRLEQIRYEHLTKKNIQSFK